MSTKIVFGVRLAFLLPAWLFVAGILFQAYLAGLALMAGGPGLLTRRAIWDTHIGLGHWIGILPALMLLLVFLGRFPRATRALTALLFGLYILQAEVFAIIRQDAPALAALHPVLALLLFVLGLNLAWRTWKIVVMELQANTPSSLPTPKW